MRCGSWRSSSRTRGVRGTAEGLPEGRARAARTVSTGRGCPAPTRSPDRPPPLYRTRPDRHKPRAPWLGRTVGGLERCEVRWMEITRIGPADWERFRDVRLASLSESPAAFGARHADWVSAPAECWQSRLTQVPLTLLAREGTTGARRCQRASRRGRLGRADRRGG